MTTPNKIEIAARRMQAVLAVQNNTATDMDRLVLAEQELERSRGLVELCQRRVEQLLAANDRLYLAAIDGGARVTREGLPMTEAVDKTVKADF